MLLFYDVDEEKVEKTEAGGAATVCWFCVWCNKTYTGTTKKESVG